MLRSLTVFAACVGLCATAAAQGKAPSKKNDKPAPPPDEFNITVRAVVPQPPLIREYRAEYLARQLDMTPEQRQQYAGQVQTILMAPPPPVDLERVRILYNKLRAADKSKDQAQVDKIRAELRTIGASQNKEPEFVENVKKFLTPEQGRILEDQVARLRRNPSGALRPVDVFDYLNTMKLSPEQHKQLDTVLTDFRELSSKSARKDGPRRAQLMRGLLRKCNEVLNEQQKADLKAFVERTRPDRVPDIGRMDGAIGNLSKHKAPKQP